MLLRNGLPWLTLLSILPLWEFSCWLLAVPDFILPRPSVIATAFWQVGNDRWLTHLAATLYIALAGFSLSMY